MSLREWFTWRNASRKSTVRLGSAEDLYVTLGVRRLEPRIVLSGPPTAVAAVSPELLYFVAEGSTIQLDGSASFDDVDPAAGLTYAWDLDDNGSFETSGVTPTFDATAIDGRFDREVYLQVTDSEGNQSGVSTARVIVYDTTAANDSAVSHAVQSGEAVVVTGTTASPFNASSVMTIDWGDGQNSIYDSGDVSGSDITVNADGTFYASHVYSSGTFTTYDVQVSYSTSDLGTTDLGSSQVYVTDGTASLQGVTVSGVFVPTASLAEGDLVQVEFTASGDDPNEAFEILIEWGDGTTSTEFFDQVGTYTVQHVLADDSTQSPGAVFSLSMELSGGNGTLQADDLVSYSVANSNPVFEFIAPVSSPNFEGDTVTVEGFYFDNGSLDSHSIEVNWGDGNTSTSADGGVIIDVSTSSFSASHVYAGSAIGESGTTMSYSLSATITDDDGGVGNIFENLLISDVGPVFGSISTDSSTVTATVPFTLTGTISDPGVDDYTITVDWGDGTQSVYDTDSGLIDTTGGSITYNASTKSFDVSHTYAASGDYGLTITAEQYEQNSSGNTATATPTISVADVPTVPVVSVDTPSEINEGGTLSLTGTFTDLEAPYDHLVTIDWGDGTTSSSALGEVTITTSDSSTVYGYSASHTYANDRVTTTDGYTVNVSVTDAEGTGTGSTTAVVNNVAPDLSNIAITPSSADEGESVTLTGNFSEPGVADVLQFLIYWEDGSVSSSDDGSVTVNRAAGTFSATHVYLSDRHDGLGDPLPYSPYVYVSDDSSGYDFEYGSVTVADVLPSVVDLQVTDTITEGSSFTLTGRIDDPGSEYYRITIDWGDGNTTVYTSPPPGVTSAPPVGADGTLTFDETAKTFTATYTYTDDNPTGTTSDEMPISVTVEQLLYDDYGGQLSGDFGSGSAVLPVTVNNAAPVLGSLSLSPTSITEGGGVSVSFTLADEGSADTHTIVIDWGDGLTSSSADGTVTFNSSLGAYSAFHQYYDNNGSSPTYTITATATDDDGGSGSASATIAVANVAPVIEAVTPSATTFNEGDTVTLNGTYFDPGIYDTQTIVIDWGDGTTSSSANGEITYSSETFTFTASHTYTDNPVSGSTYTYTVTMTDPAGGSDTSSGSVTVNNVAPALSGFSFPTSANEGDTVAVGFTVTDPGSDSQTITIDWGDGNSSTYSNVASGAHSYTHVYKDNPASGSYTATVTVTDDDGGSASQSQQISISNVDPILSQLTFSPSTVVEGDTVIFSGRFADPGTLDTQTIYIYWGDGTYSSSADGGVTINLAGGTFSAAHTYTESSDNSPFSVYVDITDKDGGFDFETVNIQVSDVLPQIVDLQVTQPVIEGSLITLTGRITDSGDEYYRITINWGDGNSTVYTQAPVISGDALLAAAGTLVYDSATGIFTATYTYIDEDPTGTASDVLPVSVTVEQLAYDDYGGLIDGDFGSATGSLPVTVNNADPELGGLSLSSTSIDEGGGVTVTGTLTDAGAADTHSIVITWGDGSTSSTADGTVTFNQSTGQWSAFHQYHDNNGTSPTYTIIATVTDDDLGSDSVSADITVANVAPIFEGVTPSATVIGEGGLLTLTGSFDDPGIFDELVLVITWGDGSTSSTADGGITLNYETMSFEAVHQYLDNPSGGGAYSYILTLTDHDGAAAIANGSVTVNNVAPIIDTLTVSPSGSNEGSLVTLQGTFSDAGIDDSHTIVITWGDGSTSSSVDGSVVINADGGTFTATHRYLDDSPSGGYAITASVTDDDGGTASSATAVNVNNVAPVVTIGLDQSAISEGGTVTLTGRYTDVGTLDTHEIVITWGDGSTSSTINGTITVNSVTGTFTATHRYLDDSPAGGYNVTATVTDDDGGANSATGIVTVTNAAPAVTISVDHPAVPENGVVTVTGRFSDAGINDSAGIIITWGDGSTSSTADGSVVINGESGTFTATHRYLDDSPAGGYTVSATVTDDDGAATVTTTAVTVSNVAPAVTVALDQPTINEGGTVTLTGHFIDVGTLDTHGIVVTWGDGSTSSTADGSVTVDLESGTFTATHRYLDDSPAGGYTVTATVTDDDGGEQSATGTVTVSNVAPAMAISVDSPSIFENGNVTVTGSYSDVGLPDTHSIVITWGDGSTSSTADGSVVIDPETGTFTARHRYLDDSPAGGYRVNVTVTDDDGGAVSTVTSVDVSNIAPTVAISVDAPRISEGGSVTLTGSYGDPGLLDTHEIVIRWGDGSTSSTADGSVVIDPETGTFTATHTYLNESPAGGYQIMTTVTDDDGGMTSSNLSVVVTNLAPDVDLAVDSDVINEGETVTLTGRIADSGLLDSHTIVITWGDGSTSSTADGSVTLDLQTGIFTASHRYLDDSPAGGYIVSATVSDGSADQTVSTAVTVLNVAPQLGDLDLQSIIDEGNSVTLSGRITDPGVRDTFQLLVDWGDGTRQIFTYPAGTTVFSEQHTYVDDGQSGTTADRYRITLTLIDDDSGQDLDAAEVTIRNLPPVLSDLVIDRVAVTPGEVIVLTGRLSDFGIDDTHNIIIRWGDGTTSSVADGTVILNDDGTFSARHAYTASREEPTRILITAVDDDGGEASGELSVLVNTPPQQVDPDQPRFPVPRPNTAIDEPLDERRLIPVRTSEFTPTPLLAMLDTQFRREAVSPPEPVKDSSFIDDLDVIGTEEGGALSDVRSLRVLLRVIGPDGSAIDEIEVDNAVLTQLPGWYSRLLDDHYRLYVVREDGTELLHSDVVVRQGKPIDPNDAAEAGYQRYIPPPLNPEPDAAAVEGAGEASPVANPPTGDPPTASGSDPEEAIGDPMSRLEAEFDEELQATFAAVENWRPSERFNVMSQR